MIKPFHLAAQYLATTAISFLDKEEDDSHTNLGWKNGTLLTHPLNKENCQLVLDYQRFCLFWKNHASLNSCYLHGKSHKEIVNWIEETSQNIVPNKTYSYALHYELPYENNQDCFVFEKPSDILIENLISQRTLVQEALIAVFMDLEINAPIRIWPHHFDTGSFFMANHSIGIGVGMAIPDNLINDFYLYVSGYEGHEAIVPNDPKSITLGTYYNQKWKGFAVPISGLNLSEAISFFKESIYQYQ